jgi:integrase-like protein
MVSGGGPLPPVARQLPARVQGGGEAAGLTHLQLKGPYDLRHTFATWLEDAGIPARVIDELMGHQGGRTAKDGSGVGARYRHTTGDTLASVLAAIDERLAVALASAFHEWWGWFAGRLTVGADGGGVVASGGVGEHGRVVERAVNGLTDAVGR